MHRRSEEILEEIGGVMLTLLPFLPILMLPERVGDAYEPPACHYVSHSGSLPPN
jgi:hypothetical protein